MNPDCRGRQWVIERLERKRQRQRQKYNGTERARREMGILSRIERWGLGGRGGMVERAGREEGEEERDVGRREGVEMSIDGDW